MKHIILPVALSVSLVGLSAAPGHAQIRRSNSTAAPAAATSPAAGARTGTELRLFIGPAFEAGNANTSLARTQSKTTTNTTTQGTTTTTTSNASPSVSNFGSFGDGIGLMYGVDGTWWGADRLGLGANLFGAYLNAGQTTNIQHLNGQQASTFLTTVSGAQTTVVGETISITPGAGLGVGALTTTIGPTGGAGSTVVSTTYGGFTTPAGASAFVLRSGTSAAAAPNSTFTSTGGASYTQGRTFWLNDVGLNANYVVWDNPSGAVSFFGGFTIPTAFESRSFTAKTTGANNSGDVASETENAVGATAADTATVTRSWKYNQSYASNMSLFALGPVLGLNATYALGGMQVYSQVGYAPVLIGTATTNTVTVVSNEVTQNVTTAGAGAGGYTAGTTVNRVDTRTEGQVVAPISGSEAIGSLGLGFGMGGMRLFTEGTARSYLLGAAGSQLVYGLKVGGTFQF